MAVKALLQAVLRGALTYLDIMERWLIFLKFLVAVVGKGFDKILKKILARTKKPLYLLVVNT